MTGFDANPSSLRGAVDLTALVQKNQQPAASAAAPVPESAGIVRTATDATLGGIAELSMTVPVVLVLSSPRSEPSEQFATELGSIAESFGGKLVLAVINADENPQIVQALQAQSVPTVAGLMGGRPLPMFEGIQPREAVVGIFEQLLQLSAENGVTGTVEATPTDAEPAPEPLPPLHQEAFDAIEENRLADAVAAYEKAIAQNPRDNVAKTGLSQVHLLQRLEGASLNEIRANAAAHPKGVDEQLAVADLDLSGGHINDAFDRLLSLYPEVESADQTRLRERLLEFFDVVGIEDPRVMHARARLTNLLF